MRNHLTKTLALLLITSGLLAACIPEIMYPTSTDLEYSRDQWPGTEMTDLNKGMEIYTSKCGSCHGLYRPDALTIKQWRDTLPNMALEAKMDTQSWQYDNLRKYIFAVRERMVHNGQGASMHTSKANRKE